MKVLGFHIRVSSFYSPGVPWSRSSAYPIPPPSAICGMLANALWLSSHILKTDEHPAVACLRRIIDKAKGIWAGMADGIAVSTTGTVKDVFGGSTVYKDDSVTKGGKKVKGIRGKLLPIQAFIQDNPEARSGEIIQTDILPRQFLFAPDGFRVFVASEDGEFLEKVKYALQHAPVYLGDSEGLANVMNVEVVDATEEKPNGMCDVSVYFRDDLASGIDGDGGTLYWVNERAILPGEKKEPMVSYLFPVIQRGKTFRPSKLLVRFNGKAKLLKAFGEILPM
ncbi:MAG: type I-A CRISPR-associated protein Cas5a [candidate division WOR-3 bacterium]